MRALIFANGELANLHSLKIRKGDFLIGVDGGTRLILKLNLKPDLIIGDLDSLKNVPKNIPLIMYPQDKDFTDTELALNYCRKQGFKEVVLVGILGRRLDHLIANLFLACSFNLTVVEGKQTIYLIKPTRFNLEGKPGDLVSLIPLLGDCSGVTTTGLKWRLQGETLKLGSSRGMSNVMVKKRVAVLKRGCLLLIHTFR